MKTAEIAGENSLYINNLKNKGSKPFLSNPSQPVKNDSAT
jgi:hypothetical protein